MRLFQALFGALLVLTLLLPPRVEASEALTLSVTPPLFQLTMGAGEYWASTLKIVNTNDYDVTYYATPVNFESTGERGTGNFRPVAEDFGAEHDEASLAHWIQISKEPLLIPAGQSKDVPFAIQVPTDAPPGGHYAAVLVGTQPPEASSDGSRIGVSSYVSTLFFLKLRGDVVEDGRIREFTTNASWYESPEATFVVRFENTGTVHVRPVGDIRIYNMWGKERGVIEINQGTSFGNVLPKSVRRYEFLWTGEASPFDIGRYKAILTVGYGDAVKRNATATTYFWVVPVMPVATTVGTLIAFVLLTVFFIRRYIRRVLRVEQERLGVVAHEPPSRQKSVPKHSFLGRHAVLVGFLIYIGISALGFFWYFGEALVDTRTYTVQELSDQTESTAEILEND